MEITAFDRLQPLKAPSSTSRYIFTGGEPLQ